MRSSHSSLEPHSSIAKHNTKPCCPCCQPTNVPSCWPLASVTNKTRCNGSSLMNDAGVQLGQSEGRSVRLSGFTGVLRRVRSSCCPLLTGRTFHQKLLCECSNWLSSSLSLLSLLSLLLLMLSSLFLMLLFVVKPLHGGSCPTRTRAADLLSLGQEIRLLVQRFRPKGGSAPLGRMWEGEEGCSCSSLGC